MEMMQPPPPAIEEGKFNMMHTFSSVRLLESDTRGCPESEDDDDEDDDFAMPEGPPPNPDDDDSSDSSSDDDDIAMPAGPPPPRPGVLPPTSKIFLIIVCWLHIQL